MKKEGHSCTHCGNEDIFFMGYCRDCTTKMMQKLGEMTFPEKWEKEWEDTIIYENDTGPKDEGFWEWIELRKEGSMTHLVEKYLLYERGELRTHVTVKVRKDMILIERTREVRNASKNTGEASEGGPEDSLAPDE